MSDILKGMEEMIIEDHRRVELFPPEWQKRFWDAYAGSLMQFNYVYKEVEAEMEKDTKLFEIQRQECHRIGKRFKTREEAEEWLKKAENKDFKGHFIYESVEEVKE